MAERPKRSTRKSAKLLESEGAGSSSQPATGTSTTRPKRKVAAHDEGESEYELPDLLQYPKSVLTTMDISDLINSTTWDMLLPEHRERLAKLLPPTAFKGFRESIAENHPAAAKDPNAMDIDSPSSQIPDSNPNPEILDPSFFTDPHFLAAAHTFQDHIYFGWLTSAHKEKVTKFEEGVRDMRPGSGMHAPWKDEEWERINAGNSREREEDTSAPGVAVIGSVAQSGARAGEAAEIRLYELARNNVLRVGDVLAYKRNFSTLDTMVEKDVIIHSINTRMRSLSILIQPGTEQHLPAHLLLPDPDPGEPTQIIEITSPSMLETGVLDLDGRVERSKRPNGNAWKCFTVWRWRDGSDAIAVEDNRGGRENHGTLFYLRGCFYSDR
ncbi:hypothetical protein Moror_11745 [Moniliophthora roreri MCA 2997]|uniref:ASX DEUBAD domain-containing protein n=2 Tax=Moniliophthora roreri TaxID=221103 RepID=V2WS17_MONRO|nr:hypothetical protein Moror_11745 [Moniliophthora roreri MCA 2997]KAI3615087.1 hypothetical protein WG66_016781 [Moniliophthora roreri]